MKFSVETFDSLLHFVTRKKRLEIDETPVPVHLVGVALTMQ